MLKWQFNKVGPTWVIWVGPNGKELHLTKTTLLTVMEEEVKMGKGCSTLIVVPIPKCILHTTPDV